MVFRGRQRKNVVIKLVSVGKCFERAGDRPWVLRDISLEFKQGFTYALTGSSGVGKSTLLHIIAGLENPTTGDVLYHDIALSNASQAEHAEYLQNTVGLVFQYPYLIPELTVLENVALKGLIVGMSEDERSARAGELLHAVGLGSYADQRPRALSGGEQQRVALARALFLRPQFLLADEPTAHLDTDNAQEIVRLMKKFQHEYGMGVIVCTHDAELAQTMEHVILLKKNTVF